MCVQEFCNGAGQADLARENLSEAVCTVGYEDGIDGQSAETAGILKADV